MDRLVPQERTRTRYAFAGAGVALVLAIASWLYTNVGSSVVRINRASVEIGTATSGRFEDFVEVRGTVAPLVTNYLTTNEGGIVTQVRAKDGDIVTKDQVLIVLSNASLELGVASQQLALEQTRFKYEHDILDIEHQLIKIKSSLIRDKILVANNAIARSTYDEDLQEYAYYVKLKSVTIASRDLEDRIRKTELLSVAAPGSVLGANDVGSAAIEALTIRAPMKGQLTALDAEIGQTKPSGAILGQVDSLDRFELTAQVDEFYLNRVVLGQDAQFVVGDRTYRARVSNIHPKVNNGTFRVDFHFVEAPPLGIHTGQAVDIKVEMGAPTRAVLLPAGSFVEDTGGGWAFVLSKDGETAQRRNIKLGRRNFDFLEVLGGLRPGDHVITSSYANFSKFDRVVLDEAGNDER